MLAVIANARSRPNRAVRDTAVAPTAAAASAASDVTSPATTRTGTPALVASPEH